MAKINGINVKEYPAGVTVDVMKRSGEAIVKMMKCKDAELKKLTNGLKGEYPQLVKDLKGNLVTSRETAFRDFFKRLNEAIVKANEELSEAPDEPPDFSGPWTWASASLSAAPKGASDDLNDLIAKKPNVFRTSIGTLVGGTGIKSGTKVAGLNHDSARIDVQSPPKKGVQNVQFQVGGGSVACVIFTLEDDESKVFKYLKESLAKKQKAISPAAQHVIDGL